MSMRAALVFGLCFASVAGAHDFWVQPNAYWVTAQGVTSMTLQVGHGPFRQRSPIQMNRITRFDAIAPNGATIDLRRDLNLGDEKEDGHFRFDTPGAYVMVLETDDRAESHLPAIRFNAYLQEEGLTPALELRQRMHRMDADGSENYGRRAKSLVLVGPAGASSQAHFMQPVGLTLEIVPERSPYAESASGDLPVHVLYHGRRLAGALVKLTNLEHDSVPAEMHITDAEGRASFTLPRAGSWLLNVIWTQPQGTPGETEFETVFSSLSFGFPARL